MQAEVRYILAMQLKQYREACVVTDEEMQLEGGGDGGQ